MNELEILFNRLLNSYVESVENRDMVKNSDDENCKEFRGSIVKDELIME